VFKIGVLHEIKDNPVAVGIVFNRRVGDLIVLNVADVLQYRKVLLIACHLYIIVSKHDSGPEIADSLVAFVVN